MISTGISFLTRRSPPPPNASPLYTSRLLNEFYRAQRTRLLRCTTTAATPNGIMQKYCRWMTSVSMHTIVVRYARTLYIAVFVTRRRLLHLPELSCAAVRIFSQPTELRANNDSNAISARYTTRRTPKSITTRYTSAGARETSRRT